MKENHNLSFLICLSALLLFIVISLFCHFIILPFWHLFMLFFPSFRLWTTEQFLFPNLEESIASFIYIELGGRMEVYFSLLLFLLPLTSASCFGRDAHFKKSKAPVILQPNRADPTKVLCFVVADFWYYLNDHLDHLCSQILVSWDQAIERPQCVDRSVQFITTMMYSRRACIVICSSFSGYILQGIWPPPPPTRSHLK